MGQDATPFVPNSNASYANSFLSSLFACIAHKKSAAQIKWISSTAVARHKRARVCHILGGSVCLRTQATHAPYAPAVALIQWTEQSAHAGSALSPPHSAERISKSTPAAVGLSVRLCI